MFCVRTLPRYLNFYTSLISTFPIRISYLEIFYLLTTILCHFTMFISFLLYSFTIFYMSSYRLPFATTINIVSSAYIIPFWLCPAIINHCIPMIQCIHHHCRFDLKALYKIMSLLIFINVVNNFHQSSSNICDLY